MSTPDIPYGVLHMAKDRGPMEYSITSLFQTIWSTPYGSFFGVIWSALGFTLEVKFFCHMEYSIWLFYDAIWSTPYGRNQRPHGVLHNVINNIHCCKNTKYSTRLFLMTSWITFSCNMEYSIWLFLVP